MTAAHPDAVTAKLSTLDRHLPVWMHTFLPRIGPIALYGLLFTIVVLFALQGDQITNNPLDVARTIGPLIEVPALVALVYVSLWAKRRFYPTDTDSASTHN